MAAPISPIDLDDFDSLDDENDALENNNVLDPLAKYARDAQRALLPKLNKQKTSIEMARELNIRYIAAIDPGTVNCAIAVIDVEEANIVYLRVFGLNELIDRYEASTHHLLNRSEVNASWVHAITWWCQEPNTPLALADLVVIERQSFSREMCSVQTAFHAALCNHRPAVQVDASDSSRYLYVPKPYILAANAVKSTFGGMFNLVEPPSPSSKSSSAFGMGDSHRNAETPQHASNKLAAKRWGALIFHSALGMQDFRDASSVRRTLMTSKETCEAVNRLETSKSDDLYDALLMCVFAADILIPEWWARAFLVENTRLTRVVRAYSQPPYTKATHNSHATLLRIMRERTRAPQSVITMVLEALKQSRTVATLPPRMTKKRQRLLESGDCTIEDVVGGTRRKVKKKK